MKASSVLQAGFYYSGITTREGGTGEGSEGGREGGRK